MAHLMNANYEGRCADPRCGRLIPKGQQVMFFGKGGGIYHVGCGNRYIKAAAQARATDAPKGAGVRGWAWQPANALDYRMAADDEFDALMVDLHDDYLAWEDRMLDRQYEEFDYEGHAEWAAEARLAAAMGVGNYDDIDYSDFFVS